MNKRKVWGKDKYLVRWKGFTAEGDTWESRENLENAGELLKKFEEEYRKDDREVRKQERIEDEIIAGENSLDDTPPGSCLDG